MIIVQSPLRISLFGGGTDFPSFFIEEGGCVLSTTIDKYIFVTIKQRFDDRLRIGYTQTEIVDSVDQIQHELIREALRKTGITRGVEITTMGDIPTAGSGLGSSSTVTVGALHAMYSYLGDTILPDQLAAEACQIEIDELRKPIGIQDQYIAAYGGLRFIEFKPGGEVCCHRVAVEPMLKRKLAENLLLYYTGQTRKAASILHEQRNRIDKSKTVLSEMKDLTYRAHDELVRGNLDAIGQLLHESWTLKKKLASKISNGTINDMYEAARKAGALGGKVTGAGGGGFILLYCPNGKRDEVRAALNGYQELPVQLEPDGTKVIFNYRR